MSGDPLYSSATSAMLVAMTALQCARGAEPTEALHRAHDVWREHVRDHSDSWEFSRLEALVRQLGEPSR